MLVLSDLAMWDVFLPLVHVVSSIIVQYFVYPLYFLTWNCRFAEIFYGTRLELFQCIILLFLFLVPFLFSPILFVHQDLFKRFHNNDNNSNKYSSNTNDNNNDNCNDNDNINNRLLSVIFWHESEAVLFILTRPWPILNPSVFSM